MAKKENFKIKEHVTVRGKVVERAHYFPQKLKPYQNNPWIESYLQIIDEDKFIKKIG